MATRLEVIAWLGMVMLLMLTGIETDVRLLKNLGRAAFAASIFGMAVPFVFGLALGLWMPSAYVAALVGWLLLIAALSSSRWAEFSQRVEGGEANVTATLRFGLRSLRVMPNAQLSIG